MALLPDAFEALPQALHESAAVHATEDRGYRRSVGRILYFLMLCSCIIGFRTSAQELEPRAYSPNPTGVNFLVAGYAHSSGGVLFDASLPFSDVEAELNAAVAGYGGTFGLFGRSANVAIAVPYVWGDVSGNIGEDRREVTRSGMGDIKLKLAVNLFGGEALSPAEFAQRTPKTTLGGSVTVSAPTGQYDPLKLINIGTNRWAFKPELGLSHPMGNWFFDAYAGVWVFTNNDDFYGGQRREQEPIVSLQAHVSYAFRPRLWIAANATYYRGGETTIDGVPRADLQENTRLGLTLSVPLGKAQSLKLAWSDGTTTRIGGDFTVYGVTWQYMWFD